MSAERRTAAATAEDGFALEQVAEGRYRLWGHAAPAAERWPFEEDQAGVAIVVSPGDGVIETQVALDRTEGCDVNGIVRGLLAGESARELTHFNRRQRRRQVARADDAGRFALSVRPGAIRVRARTSAGRVLTRRVQTPCAAGDPLDFHFNGRSRLYGAVTRHGEPLRATVRVQALVQDADECGFDVAASRRDTTAATPRPDCAPIFGASAATSPSGQYAIRGLRSGTYALEVVGTGHRREVRVARDTRVDIRLRDDERLVDFAGVVTAADTQQPLPGVYVSLRLKEEGAGQVITQRTDSNGAFSARLTPGTYRVFANKTGFAAQWRDQAILEATKHAAISLAPAAGARVRVTDAETGQPLPWVALTVADQGVPLRLTKAGTANLWRDLEGQDLLFRHANYEEVRIPSWDGAPLDIQMRGHAAAAHLPGKGK